MPFADLAGLAADQWGLVTTAQAEAAGCSRKAIGRFAQAGLLERLAQGIYRLTGAPPDPLEDLRAAWLALDPGRSAGDRLRDELPELVSHRSAAALYELGDLAADRHEFTVSGRRQSRRIDIRFHRATLQPSDWTIVQGLPCATIPRTIADLAAVHTDGGHLAGAVRDALTVRHVDVDELARTISPYAARYGARRHDGEALLVRLLKESGLPLAIQQTVDLVTSAHRAPARRTA
ncbi:type IV toxin-antitoxin system AbiEi family antitoxin domain-containing protein [Kribbella sp. DT2]|uniref:type IV toxin-antitoxin system AbiEi family antitoxin domain-containing protein n=1 Tax=Kribbella sp. DT2 TaxID=3393427 RepID=UPI003CEFBCDD